MSLYSLQQLTFDALSYLKEFGRDGIWHIGATGPVRPQGQDYTVWIHRPALSFKAAERAARSLQAKYRLQSLPQPHEPGRYLFLGKCRTDPPS